MEKAKFTLRVDTEILKEMKILAIRQNMPLNEMLLKCYDMYKKKYEAIQNGDILPSVEELEIDDF